MDGIEIMTRSCNFTAGETEYVLQLLELLSSEEACGLSLFGLIGQIDEDFGARRARALSRYAMRGLV